MVINLDAACGSMRNAVEVLAVESEELKLLYMK